MPLSPTRMLIFATLLVSAHLGFAAPAAAQDPNDPGLLDAVVQSYVGRTWRLPGTHQVIPGSAGSEQINIVGRTRKRRADQGESATGQPIANVDSPSRSVRDGLRDLEDAASNNQPAAMQTAAMELEAVMLGQTSGRIYDGFSMLNHDRGAWLPDHIQGEYKAKRLSDRGRRAPGLDGRQRVVWEADVNLLYFDEDVDCDTFFLVVPAAADRRDLLQLNYTIYSTGTESFAPTTLLHDAAPFGEGHLPSKGFDAAWVPLGGNEITEISIAHGALETMRGVKVWGWYAKPDRSLSLEVVRERNLPGGGIALDTRGATMMEALRGLDLDAIGAAAPEKKILTVAQAVLAGATPNQVLQMLNNAQAAPLGTMDDWQDVLGSRDLFPVEALQILAAEGVFPDQVGPNRLGPYDAVLVYANHEVYATSLDLEGHDPVTGERIPIDGDDQSETWNVRVLNLDATTHYLQTRDYGPALHDDIHTCNYAPAGSHSLEVFVDHPVQGAPKMDELQWRTGWGFRNGLGAMPQYDVFSQLQDQPGLTDFVDQHGAPASGWQWPAADRGSDFRVLPPAEWLGPTSTSPLQEQGQDGVVIGAETPGFGIAKMPLTDLQAFHPDGLLNADTDGDGQMDALLFPDWMRNPSAQGGDLIPSTPLWQPFLYRNPWNGTIWLNPLDHSQGLWADQTFAFGEPLAPASASTFTIRRPRSLGQALWHFDGLYRDTASVPTRTSDVFTR